MTDAKMSHKLVRENMDSCSWLLFPVISLVIQLVNDDL